MVLKFRQFTKILREKKEANFLYCSISLDIKYICDLAVDSEISCIPNEYFAKKFVKSSTTASTKVLSFI